MHKLARLTPLGRQRVIDRLEAVTLVPKGEAHSSDLALRSRALCELDLGRSRDPSQE
jgi:hypothetical protein